MEVELVIAGSSSLVLAIGHAWIGLRWVLPGLSRIRLPRTSFGSSSMTLGMVRFSWHIITVMLFAFAALLIAFAWTDVQPGTLLLQWLSAFWLIATVLALWQARRRLRDLVRLPVPVFTMLIAAMCFKASL